MAVRVYNATEGSYGTIASYIAAYDEDDEDVYYIQFLYELSELFDLAKKRTSFRGRRARDEEGKSLLHLYEMTDDEEDFFDEMLEEGSGEIFNTFLAWTKNVFQSYQYKALHDFGSGDVNSLQYFLTMPTAPYMDLFNVVENKLEGALVLYTIKEWWYINRLLDDYQVDNARYKKVMDEIRGMLLQKAEPTRRRPGLFLDYEQQQ